MDKVSGLLEKLIFSFTFSETSQPLSEFFNIFLLWLKAILTTLLNFTYFSSSTIAIFFFVNLINAQFTFGLGMKTVGGIEKQYSTSR